MVPTEVGIHLMTSISVLITDKHRFHAADLNCVGQEKPKLHMVPVLRLTKGRMLVVPGCF